MLFTRRLLRLGALTGLAALLFVQAALAFAACNVDGTPSRGTALSMQVQADSPCHEEAPASDALCTTHCLASEPSLDKAPAQPTLAPVLALPPLALRVPLAVPAAPPRDVAPPASPPARILFQTLLI